MTQPALQRAIRLIAVGLCLSLTASCGGDSSDSDDSPSGGGGGDTGSSPPQTVDLWEVDGFGLAAHDIISRGVFVATDYVYDDHGPDIDDTEGGDYSYPVDGTPYMKNAADLVEVRVQPDDLSESITIGVRFNTLIDSSIPIAAIGINDGSEPTLDKPWPFNAGVKATGVRFVLSLRDDLAVLEDLLDGTRYSYPVTVANNTDDSSRHQENSFTTRIPLSDLGGSLAPQWQLHAISGLRDGDGWLQGEGTSAAFDLAFLSDDFVNWQQNRQAAVLASGDISEAVARVEFSDFPERPSPVVTGLQARVYRSPISHLIGEGIRPWHQVVNEPVKVATSSHYLGLYMPYTLWIPPQLASMRSPYPLFYFMHGVTGTHLTNLEPFADGTINYPALTLFPMGGGELAFYKGEAEIDAIEAMKDVKAHYPIDDDRVFMAGRSMGGQGSFNLGTHYPDLFAASLPFIGTGQGTFNEDVPLDPVREFRPTTNYWPNSTGREVLDNAYNLPFRITNGFQDPLVNFTWPTRDALKAESLGNDHRLMLFLNRGHAVVYEYMNALFHQVLNGCSSDNAPANCEVGHEPSGGLVRDRNPARVVYKVVPHHFVPELGLKYDKAYWVSGLDVRELASSGDYGRIDVTSFALGHKLKGSPITMPVTFLDFEPTNDPYSFQGLRQTTDAKPAEARMHVILENLSAASLDLQRAGITALGGTALIEVTTDGDATLTLTQLSPGTRASLGNETLAIAGADGAVSIALAVGEHHIQLQP